MPTPVASSARPSHSPSPSGFPEGRLSACNGKPSGQEVLAAVRRTRTDFPATGVTVQQQPKCAGVWQYTVLAVAGSEPQQVVTKGAPTALTVVTVGTDPCTIEVVAQAPAALLKEADCE